MDTLSLVLVVILWTAFWFFLGRAYEINWVIRKLNKDK